MTSEAVVILFGGMIQYQLKTMSLVLTLLWCQVGHSAQKINVLLKEIDGV